MEPCDHKGAGVLSKAGGLTVGIRLGHGNAAHGAIPFAMTGRVYVRCTAENDSIRPGDLLSKSGSPGMAMLTSDPVRQSGATIGKAMTSLGKGRCLVLVSLQSRRSASAIEGVSGSCSGPNWRGMVRQ
jgi:hypothetical protein